MMNEFFWNYLKFFVNDFEVEFKVGLFCVNYLWRTGMYNIKE